MGPKQYFSLYKNFDPKKFSPSWGPSGAALRRQLAFGEPRSRLRRSKAGAAKKATPHSRKKKIKTTPPPPRKIFITTPPHSQVQRVKKPYFLVKSS